MIVITHPQKMHGETDYIHALVKEGLTWLHIRKPGFSEAAMKQLLLSIDGQYWPQIVLHQHHQLAPAFQIDRLHFTGMHRQEAFNFNLYADKHLSTSVHTIGDFNALPKEFDYAFLSPVFSSISKPGYQPQYDMFEAVKQRTNFATRLIALGGINKDNLQQALHNGFDDIAILGAIWNSDNPIQNFKQCLQNVRLH